MTNARDRIEALHEQRFAASDALSKIERGIEMLREHSLPPNGGAKMAGHHARAAFAFVCDALGMDPAEVGDKFIEHAVRLKARKA